MTLSRRNFIHLVGRAGGAAAAYRTMAAMGLMPVPAAYAGPPPLVPGSGKGTRVVIIGAGIAGMVAAYELAKAGYDCRVLEARSRPGGRNWTLRAGDVIEETDTRQTVAWDRGEAMYFNPGPARLPYHHQGILGYCRELGVPLEVMINDNRGAYFQDDAAFGGAPQLARRVINDSRGFIAELAAKAVDRDLLDQPVSTEDKEKLRAYLRAFGALDEELHYRGSPRAGYAAWPGAADQSGTINPPIDLRQLLASDFWQVKMNFGEGPTQAATMLQPVGGMGRIGAAFGRKLGKTITYDAEVIQLRRVGDGARIVWRHRKTGATRALDASHVICTIPLPALRALDADFAPELKRAMAAVGYIPAAKIAFQAERRFWELDQQIYGGISWTSRDITQIWYPSAGLHQKKGILVGAYIWTDHLGEAFAAKSLNQRLVDALADGERIHPGYGASLTKGISVAWSKIPFSGAGWAEWTRAARRDAYPVLLKGDGPFGFAGEHMSYVTGWQEGSVLSAHVAIERVAQRVREKAA
jgi:monoamine oxidase